MNYQTNSNQQESESTFDNFLTSEQLKYFRLLMAAIAITCFVASILFAIQQSGVLIIAFMVVTTSVNFLMMCVSQVIKKYLKYVLGVLYLSYIAGITLVGKNGENIPLFIHGYSSGVLFSTMTQYCDYKQKVVFVLCTPWVFFILFDNLSVSNIHFIVYTLSTSVLLGFMTYQYDNKQKWLFTQDFIIKNQQNAIKLFTTDSLLAISYDERNRVFKLVFANQLFENTFSIDIKEFLRNHLVIFEGEQQMQKSTVLKQITLEEFLYEKSQKKQIWESQGVYNIKIKNKTSQNFHDLQISPAYFQKSIYFLAIKSKQENVSIEKYERLILKQKQSIIKLSSELGLALQKLYKSLSSSTEQKFLKIQQSDILIMLNRIKNYLIYYQKEKFFSIHYSQKNYELKVVLNTLMQLLEALCKQHQKLFLYQLQSVDENITMKLDQKLFTQIFVNIFYKIFTLSSDSDLNLLQRIINNSNNKKQHKNHINLILQKQIIFKFFNLLSNLQAMQKLIIQTKYFVQMKTKK